MAHVPDRRPARLEALRREASSAGVEIAILATYSDFTHPDAGYRAAQIDDTREWIASAAALGAASVRLTAGQAHPGVSEADGIAWAVDGLVACARQAAAFKVRVIYENHTRGSVWRFNDFTQPASRFLDVVRRTEGCGLEILFDTANCLPLDDDPEVVLAAVIQRLGAVHVSDIARRGGFEPTVIGTGAAPLGPLLERIAASGFDGWISIEEASRTGLDGFRHAVRFVDDLWEKAGGRPRARARLVPPVREE